MQTDKQFWPKYINVFLIELAIFIHKLKCVLDY